MESLAEILVTDPKAQPAGISGACCQESPLTDCF